MKAEGKAVEMAAGEILEVARNKVSCNISEDTLPITVAIADPAKIIIGVTIQRDYPLTVIQRSYGVPFGRLKVDPSRFISGADQLHGCKMAIEMHETIFQLNAMIEEFVRTGKVGSRILLALSTGIGNALQNFRSIAYVERTLHHVVGEQPDHPPPYTCLVEYSSPEENQGRRVGIELLLFTSMGGCQRIGKDLYFEEPSRALLEAEKGFESQIRWAVSGYPLLLGGKVVSAETTANNVSDYRHVWRLPKLEESLVKPLAGISDLEDPQKYRVLCWFRSDSAREFRLLCPGYSRRRSNIAD